MSNTSLNLDQFRTASQNSLNPSNVDEKEKDEFIRSQLNLKRSTNYNRVVKRVETNCASNDGEGQNSLEKFKNHYLHQS